MYEEEVKLTANKSRVCEGERFGKAAPGPRHLSWDIHTLTALMTRREDWSAMGGWELPEGTLKPSLHDALHIVGA